MRTLGPSMGNGTPGWTKRLPCVVNFTLLCLLCAAVGTSAEYYEWQTGIWSECYRLGCGPGGETTRPVYCKLISSNGVITTTHESNCGHLSKPPERQECFKVCREHRYEVRWAWTPWEQCKLEPGVKVCAKGRGISYRNVSCVWKENGKVEKDSVCLSFEEKPATKKRCELRCKQNCVVTEFTPWTSCDQCRVLNKTRTRTILVPDSNGGQMCPPFSELMPCRNCSGMFFLSVDAWTPCVPFSSVGTEQNPNHPVIGHQTRKIKCVNTFGVLVNGKFCRDHLNLREPIVDHQACIIPKSCIVSEWSSWDRINSSCIDSTGMKRVGLIKRTRRVLQLPVGTGTACPPLEEVTQVQGTAQRKCPRTKWIVSGWSSCQPVNGLKQCSTGLQHRKSICVEENHDGQQKPVDDSKCLEDRPLTSQTCRADCHWDCTVSLWSMWSDCKVTDCEQYARKRRANLNTGQRYRTRETLTLPGSGGQTCPHLSETQNCDPEPCYNWKVVARPCILRNTNMGEACGVGIAHRTLACLNKYKIRVSDSLCLEFRERPETQVQCEIPCPNDCVVSNWGPWSECPDRCHTGNLRERAIKRRKRTILARPFSGGGECPNARELEETADCSTLIECALFMWQADPWGVCQLEDLTRPCGRGTQTRSVKCYDSQGKLESDEKCTEKVKPDALKVCTVPCPQDCIVTEYSDWSDCSATCWEAGENVPTRTRRRFILQNPDNNGSPCPEMLEETQRCLNLPLCNQFSWVKTNWSSCVLPPVVRGCGKGIRTRNVTCRSENSTRQAIDVCLRYAGAMPSMYSACYVSCEEECIFTDWAEWSICVQGCNGKQFRDRRPIKGSKSMPLRCEDKQLYPLYEHRPCYCKTLEPIIIGEWSQCILDPPNRHDLMMTHLSGHRGIRLARNITGPEVGNSCGAGRKYKVVACRNVMNAMESADKCTLDGKDTKEKTCRIPCPVDCKMSSWSTWSLCPTKCGAGVQQRFRNNMKLPSPRGRQCPSLDNTLDEEIQTRLCHPECVQYTWKASDWDMCMPPVGERCGDGQQNRHVSCNAVNINGVMTERVDDGNCAGLPEPRSTRSCYLPCPGDCVLSEWTEWSQCQQPCNHNQMQQRERTIRRESAAYSEYQSTCPPLTESRHCIRGENCIEYSWELAQWTTCLVNNGLDDCGVGHKERYAICKNHFGRVVDNKLCKYVHGQVTEPLVVSCEIPCDVDCLLSDWSPWSACSKSCGLGTKKRNRSIVQQYIGNGRPCPTILSQAMHCFSRGCYKWEISDWSLCSTQLGVCGHGVQTRNITCRSDNGLVVDSSRCPRDLTTMVSPKEQPCHVPCPGECVVTDWSNWSQCYIPCHDFEMGYTEGVRSRSRSILAYPGPKKEKCPDQLWTSESCYADTCSVFRWMSTPWEGDYRDVWCERSDGLRIFGGCDRNLRPLNLLSCSPPCNQDNAYCNDTNYCACEEGFIAYYKGDTLFGCFMDNQTVVGGQSSNEKTEGTLNFWTYAVIAVGTIFVIFVTVALYNMSDFLHYGPRPRNRDSLDELDSASNTGSASRNNPDGLTTPDNCSVCKSIPTPVDTLPNDRMMETKCNMSVGSCVETIDNHGECSSLSQILTHVCPCTSATSNTPPAKDMHDYNNETDVNSPLVLPEHIGMSTAYNCMQNSRCEMSSASTLSPRSVHQFPVRSDSEQSEDMPNFIPKSQSYPYRGRTNSDSALSASMTTASVAGTSVSSYPMGKAMENDTALTKVPDTVVLLPSNDDLTKPLSSSSLKSLTDTSEFPPNNINTESLNVLVQDFTKKIDSLSRDERPYDMNLYSISSKQQGRSFDQSTTESTSQSDIDSDTENDPLLSDPSPGPLRQLYPSLEPETVSLLQNDSNNNANKNDNPRADCSSNYSNKSSFDYSTNETESDSGSDRLYMLKSRDRGAPRRLTTIWNGGPRKVPDEPYQQSYQNQPKRGSESPKVDVVRPGRPGRPKLKRQTKLQNPLEVAQVDSGVIADTCSASSANPSIREDSSPVLQEKPKKARKLHKLQKRNSDTRISSRGSSSPSSHRSRSLPRAIMDNSKDGDRTTSSNDISDAPGSERTWKETIL
ncbi:thrombospondin type-1 domain-containing protein 7A-like isoform X2 [Pecten maximus]|uniref:thrombospondin type-1 domain-containing protein 7A-like isoform X2 n=1 Tax=Pecten maximus TaxID=6579 RepID=UPI0014584056|nr:thrombospondin type-1 domain-containing protein 7A-like isoform X2 [Pecten maximus]